MAVGTTLSALVQDVCGSFKAFDRGGLSHSRREIPKSGALAKSCMQLIGKGPPKVARLRKDATEDERIAAMLTALAEYISSCGGDGDYVLSTFLVKLETRREGSTAGTSDVYYFNDRGRRFRSRAEVARALGLVPLTGGPCQRRNSNSAIDRYLMNTEDSHQRAKRLETKLQKAINRLSRRLETSQRDRKVDDATLDPSAAPDLAVLGRPIICPNTDTTLAVGNFHHVFTSWHFLATFSNELGIGVSQDAIYNAHRHATAQKDRAILNAGPMELARRIYGATIDPCGAGTSQEDGFLGRIHRALLRLLITDSTVNLWWPDVKVSHEPIATIPSATQLPPAASDGASKRIRAMAARVKLDTEAILKCAADEPEEITQLWLEMLEGIRHLKTNSGNPIRDVILALTRGDVHLF